MGIDIFHGYGFGTAKPSGFVPVAISSSAAAGRLSVYPTQQEGVRARGRAAGPGAKERRAMPCHHAACAPSSRATPGRTVHTHAYPRW
jgi:hypothetical protein